MSLLNPNIPFINTTWLVAHNAFANKDDGYLHAQHSFNMTTLYKNGVRGFMLDLHYHRGEISLCHELWPQREKPGYCYATVEVGAPIKLTSILGTLYDIVNDIKMNNKTDAIIIFLESYALMTEVQEHFATYNLTKFLLISNPNQPSLNYREDSRNTINSF